MSLLDQVARLLASSAIRSFRKLHSHSSYTTFRRLAVSPSSGSFCVGLISYSCCSSSQRPEPFSSQNIHCASDP